MVEEKEAHGVDFWLVIHAVSSCGRVPPPGTAPLGGSGHAHKHDDRKQRARHASSPP